MLFGAEVTRDSQFTVHLFDCPPGNNDAFFDGPSTYDGGSFRAGFPTLGLRTGSNNR